MTRWATALVLLAGCSTPFAEGVVDESAGEDAARPARTAAKPAVDPAAEVARTVDAATTAATTVASEEPATPPAGEDPGRADDEPGPAAVERLTGRVLAVGDDGPVPLAGRRVRWIVDPWAFPTSGPVDRETAEGHTDEEGRFSLPRPTVRRGHFSLWCSSPDGWRLLEEHSWRRGGRAADTETMHTPQPQEVSWSVEVVDDGGEPIVGARVALGLGADGAPVGEMRPVLETGEDGRATFDRLESAAYFAHLSAPGHVPVRVRVPPLPSSARSPVVHTHSLPLGRKLIGRVVVPNPAWVRWTTVRVLPAGGTRRARWGGPAWERTVALDDEGRFETLVPAGRPVAVHAQSPVVGMSVEVAADESYVEVHVPLFE